MKLTAPVNKEPESLHKIRFQDCDPFGHLNNAAYLDYFYDAHEDHLAHHYDFQLSNWGKTQGSSWVVTQNQIAYMRPALYAEDVIIKTMLIRATETTILVEAQMLDYAKKRMKALLWAEFAYIDLTNGRTSSHNAELHKLFDAITYENTFWMDGFAKRVESFKQVRPTAEPSVSLSA